MKIALGLGSSLGPRRAHLELVLRMLHSSPGVQVLRVSRWYRTPPLRGGTARNWFLNGVALLEADHSASEMLALCVQLESRFGRRRALHWGDRTIDLDLLLYGEQIIDTPRLTVPHPAIAQRPFVRVPLREVWPDAIDPRSQRAWAQLPPATGPRPTPIGILRRFSIPRPAPALPSAGDAAPSAAPLDANTGWRAPLDALQPPATSLERMHP